MVVSEPNSQTAGKNNSFSPQTRILHAKGITAVTPLLHNTTTTIGCKLMNGSTNLYTGIYGKIMTKAYFLVHKRMTYLPRNRNI
jgi:hypothetical protein